MPPPDTLLPRLHRELEPASARQSPGRWAVVASGVAAILVVGGVAVSMGFRAGNLQDSNDLLREALAFSQRPGADTAPLGGADAAESPAPVSEIAAPDEDRFYPDRRGRPGAAGGVRLRDLALRRHRPASSPGRSSRARR